MGFGPDPGLTTDLPRRCAWGLALFPADTAKRMVVLSDGRETVGDSTEVARLAAATNVQINYVFLAPGPTEQANRTRSSDHSCAPARLRQCRRGVRPIGDDRQQPAGQHWPKVASCRQSALIYREAVRATPGDQQLCAVQSDRSDARLRRLFAWWSSRSARTTSTQNNELSAFTEVTGPPRVLLVASEDEEASRCAPRWMKPVSSSSSRGRTTCRWASRRVSSYEQRDSGERLRRGT